MLGVRSFYAFGCTLAYGLVLMRANTEQIEIAIRAKISGFFQRIFSLNVIKSLRQRVGSDVNSIPVSEEFKNSL